MDENEKAVMDVCNMLIDDGEFGMAAALWAAAFGNSPRRKIMCGCPVSPIMMLTRDPEGYSPMPDFLAEEMKTGTCKICGSNFAILEE